MVFVNRVCPICDGEVTSLGSYCEPNFKDYKIDRQVSVPLWECSGCNIQIFSLIEGLNIDGDLYQGMPFSPFNYSKRHYCLANLIKLLYPNGCKIVDIGGGNIDYQDLNGVSYSCKVLDLFSPENRNSKNIYFNLSNLNDPLNEHEVELSADITILDNVLEHLADFKCVKSLINKVDADFVYVSVPNLNSLKFFLRKTKFYRPVEHVNNFTPKSVDKLMYEIGYQRKKFFVPPRYFKGLFEIFFYLSIAFSSFFGIYHIYEKKVQTNLN